MSHTPHWTGFVIEAIALVASAVLVGLGRLPAEVFVGLAATALAVHGAGRRPPPGGGPITTAAAATGIGAVFLGLVSVLGARSARVALRTAIAAVAAVVLVAVLGA